MRLDENEVTIDTWVNQGDTFSIVVTVGMHDEPTIEVRQAMADNTEHHSGNVNELSVLSPEDAVRISEALIKAVEYIRVNTS